VIPVGYFEYAWSLFFEKDKFKTKLLIDPELDQPILSRDEIGFVIILPEPTLHEEEETISFLGYQFPEGPKGKLQTVKLFKACVFHLNAHATISDSDVYSKWEKRKDNRLAKFSESLVEDDRVNAYIAARHPDKLRDIAFANSLAFTRSRPLRRLWNPATRVMTALLMQLNVGLTKGRVSTEEWRTIDRVTNSLVQLEATFSEPLASRRLNSDNARLGAADEIYNALECYGPILEVPALPHTEKLTHCSLFPGYRVQPDDGAGEIFSKSLAVLGASTVDTQHRLEEKAVEAEAFQVYNSWSNEKAKEKKILGRYEELVLSTRFKSIAFPGEDYTEYLRARAETKSETRRLISSLMVGFDALDEDPRKLFGVLDLQEIIQVMASKNPRKDVFMRDENIGKSYAWITLLDTSRSMSPISSEVQNLSICLAETAKELLIDSSSWGIYAFNDRFLILKDPTERYGPRTKARIGALKFEGPTYMPDALHLAGEILKKRSENLRLVTVLSDGWPYGYSKITNALLKTLKSLKKSGIVVIGIGIKTSRMENFFRVNCRVKDLMDMTKKFSSLFLEASRSAVGL
jgi:hypothetical protein